MSGEWQGPPLQPGERVYPTVEPAMTLRDYFAGQALAGFCAESGSDIDYRVMARCAYDMADAMLDAREAKR